MKPLILCVCFFLFCTQLIAQVGVGTSAPDASAKLEVSSTEKGFLVPRMTTTQRNLISSPANGLLLYNTTDNELQIHKQGLVSTFGNTSANTDLLFPSNAILQSFTSTATGQLLSIDFSIVQALANTDATLTVYATNNGTGAPLGTATLTITSTGVKRFIFPSPPNLTNNGVYSFAITAPSGWIRFAQSNQSVYGGGVMWIGGTPYSAYTLYFIARTQPPGSWVNL